MKKNIVLVLFAFFAISQVATADKLDIAVEMIFEPIYLEGMGQFYNVVLVNKGDTGVIIDNITVTIEDDDGYILMFNAVGPERDWWKEELNAGGIRFYTLPIPLPETYVSKHSNYTKVSGKSYDVVARVSYHGIVDGEEVYKTKETRQKIYVVGESPNDYFSKVELNILGAGLFEDIDISGLFGFTDKKEKEHDKLDLSIKQIILTPFLLEDMPLYVEITIINIGNVETTVDNITVTMEDDDGYVVSTYALMPGEEWWEEELDKGDVRLYHHGVFIPETYESKMSRNTKVAGNGYDIVSSVSYHGIVDGEEIYKTRETRQTIYIIGEPLNDLFNKIDLKIFESDVFEDIDIKPNEFFGFTADDDNGITSVSQNLTSKVIEFEEEEYDLVSSGLKTVKSAVSRFTGWMIIGNKTLVNKSLDMAERNLSEAENYIKSAKESKSVVSALNNLSAARRNILDAKTIVSNADQTANVMIIQNTGVIVIILITIGLGVYLYLKRKPRKVQSEKESKI